jgi:ATP-binding cassette subfamily B protein
MAYPFHKQFDSFDCGPTCLQMVSDFFGKKFDIDFLRKECFITREGVSLLGISQAGEKIGFRTLMAKVTSDALKQECPLPAILHWNQEHFVVLYNIKQASALFTNKKQTLYTIGDPAHGIITIKEEDFLKNWQTSENNRGITLLLEPTSAFFESKSNNVSAGKEIKLMLAYLRPFRKQLMLLLLCMSVSVAITISLPYLTKGLIDKGVLGKSHNLIVLFVLSQLILYVSSSILDVVRGWLLLHMNAKISINIISDFLKKLMKLPISFFDSKSVGDVSQRINDHHKIETFLSSDLSVTLFSLLQILVLSFILLSYKFDIWITFAVLSLIGTVWVFLFQKKRKQLDYIRFAQSKNVQEKLFELVVGMQEIKLFGSEDEKRWEWEYLQLRQYKINIKSLKLEQYQQSGFIFFSQLKNLVISYLAATSVMDGEISLGIMLSISFIIGQTNGPLQQLVQFFKSGQDAKLSFSRLQEVHYKNDEEDTENAKPKNTIPEHGLIQIENLNFQYQGPRSPHVLKNVNIDIPKGKITAIVGASGSGKTTFLKLLLGFYTPTSGTIAIGGEDLSDISPRAWRRNCGTVMQDGYIFNDTIYKNIVVDGNNIDSERFNLARNISNLDEFVNELPMDYNTKIGASGIGLSGGQKQRVLLARAIYKDPDYLFFDEATSNLDANNETQIMDRLDNFFIGKTVVVIAHRLSTVRNADQIIVLEKGEIVEVGNHTSLTLQKGRYYELIKNQLELGV